MHWSATREWTAHSARTFGFVTVDVDGSRAYLRALDTTGMVFDERASLLVDPEGLGAFRWFVLASPGLAEPGFRRPDVGVGALRLEAGRRAA